MADSTSLFAPYSIEFDFTRTVGPKVGTFLGGLRDGVLLGVRGSGGAVWCPVAEFDPATGEETGDFVTMEPVGRVEHFTWVPARPGDPIGHDYAWALITIDGASGSFLHAVDVGGDPGALTRGLRVRPRWAAQRVGDIRDIVCFEPVHP